MNPYLSVIIPCYNEEKRLPKTLDRVLSYLHQQSYSWEVIVVDNGSSDRTPQLVETAMKNEPQLKLATDPAHGKGWAVHQGLLKAAGEWRLFTDADNSTDIAEIEKLLPFTEEGFDVIVSSRKIKGAAIAHPQPLVRKVLGTLFRLLVSFIVPTGVIDTQNGFKLFSAKAVANIFPKQKIYYWAFDVEILALARKCGFKVKEVPIVWNDAELSKVSLKGMLRMLSEVAKIRWNLWTGKYK
jgi:dolichyl-phosphate beta-glucosyltransferase